MGEAPETLLLRVEGEAPQTLAAAWLQALLEALHGGRPTVVDLSEATALTLPVFQVLLAARRAFGQCGTAFQVRDPQGVGERLAAAVGVRQEGNLG